MKALGEMENLKEVLDELRVLGAAAPQPRIRFQAERILKAVRPPRGIDFGTPADLSKISRALCKSDPELRIQAARALRQVDPEMAFPLALEAVQREDHPWVLSTLTSLIGLKGEAQPEEALECARKLLAHPSPRVSSNALLALLSLNPSEGVKEARERLEEDDPRLRTSAIMATYTSEPELAWTQVLAMLEAEDIWMRTSGSFLAAKLNHDDSERALLEALVREQDPSLVLRTLDWFGRSGTEACLERLELIAHLGEQQYREAALKSLEQVKERVQTHAPPDRTVSPAVLESGFHLTGVIPSLTPALMPTEDSLDSPSSEDLLRNLVRQELIRPQLEGDNGYESPPGGTEKSDGASTDSPNKARGLSRLATLAIVTGALSLGVFLGFRGTQPPAPGAPGPTATAPRAPPPPSAPPPIPTSRPTEVRLVGGRLDLNRQPSAGKRGLWKGRLVQLSGRQLDLEVGDGIPMRFLLQEDLEAPGPKGTEVLVSGIVARKARAGITLTSGVQLHLVPEVEGDLLSHE
jgi:hypothetical protein